MKKALIFAALSTVLCLCLCVGATAAEQLNWYFKRGTDGNGRPIVMDGSPIPDRYGAIYMGNPDDKVIYLTFDAGYGNENLDSILETLAAEDVKATFFILPAVIKYAPQSLDRMIADGHLVANHTYSHCNMARLSSADEIKRELTALEDCYREATGQEMAHYYRPPEGAFTEQTLAHARALGYTAVFWSFAYADWDNAKQPNPDTAKEKLLSTAHNGEVMLLHPNSATNAAILGEVIATLKEQGYRFARIDELS